MSIIALLHNLLKEKLPGIHAKARCPEKILLKNSGSPIIITRSLLLRFTGLGDLPAVKNKIVR